MKSTRRFVSAFLILYELLLIISYYSIGVLTANYNSSTKNLVYIIILILLEIIKTYLCYKRKEFLLVFIHFLVSFLVGFPYSTFFLNVGLDGLLSKIYYCGVHDNNLLFFIISFLIFAIVDLFLLIKMKKESNRGN